MGKPMCSNCKHASSPFKIADLTHYCCNHPKHDEGLYSGELSAWGTLREWYDTCDSHELKDKKTPAENYQPK